MRLGRAGRRSRKEKFDGGRDVEVPDPRREADAAVKAYQERDAGSVQSREAIPVVTVPLEQWMAAWEKIPPAERYVYPHYGLRVILTPDRPPTY
jgi:hypothetical protein